MYTQLEEPVTWHDLREPLYKLVTEQCLCLCLQGSSEAPPCAFVVLLESDIHVTVVSESRKGHFRGVCLEL